MMMIVLMLSKAAQTAMKKFLPSRYALLFNNDF